MATTAQEVGLIGGNDIADTAVAFAQTHLSDVVFGHSARSFRYAAPTAAAQGFLRGRDYDEEIVFLICVLHDLGVSAIGNGPGRFEVDGADAARHFLIEAGYPMARAQQVWTGIALHSSEGIVDRISVDAGVAHIAIATDMAGVVREALPLAVIQDAERAFPRLDLGYAFAQELAALIAQNPSKATPLNFSGHIAAVTSTPGTYPTWFDVIEQSGWDDRPSYGRAGVGAVATAPEDLGGLFRDRLNERDVDGLIALFEPEAVFVGPGGSQARGSDAIRKEFEAMVAANLSIDLHAGPATQSVGVAIVASTVTITSPDGAQVTVDTVEVSRRQADGRWLLTLDSPADALGGSASAGSAAES